jgi:hypothetical protein
MLVPVLFNEFESGEIFHVNEQQGHFIVDKCLTGYGIRRSGGWNEWLVVKVRHACDDEPIIGRG